MMFQCDSHLEKKLKRHQDDEQGAHNDEVVGDFLCSLALRASRIRIRDVELEVGKVEYSNDDGSIGQAESDGHPSAETPFLLILIHIESCV